jgi:hypothetical protein
MLCLVNHGATAIEHASQQPMRSAHDDGMLPWATSTIARSTDCRQYAEQQIKD